LELWKTGTPQEQVEFMKGLAQEYCVQTNCAEANIAAFTDDTTVYFHIQCVRKIGEVSL
jgi:hypothetical protein